MKKLMMMVVVAASTLAVNAQTPCKPENCDKNKEVPCNVQSDPCCDNTDCSCPEGTQACGTECKPCGTEGKTCDDKTACQTACASETPADAHHCTTEKGKACHSGKHHGSKSHCRK